ncbi:MAG: hypothetical protein MUC94_16015 [bacterium]|nr:hypothetical protein [bacterium]
MHHNFKSRPAILLIFTVFILFPLRSFAQPAKLPGFTTSQFFDEQLITFKYPKDVTIHINNGNTIDWTIGKEAGPNEDWHYEIQHIGAQTRFLRNLVHDRNIVTVYLEADGLSWPTWSGNHANDKYTLIYALVDSIRMRYRIISSASRFWTAITTIPMISIMAQNWRTG